MQLNIKLIVFLERRIHPKLKSCVKMSDGIVPVIHTVNDQILEIKAGRDLLCMLL